MFEGKEERKMLAVPGYVGRKGRKKDVGCNGICWKERKMLAVLGFVGRKGIKEGFDCTRTYWKERKIQQCWNIVEGEEKMIKSTVLGPDVRLKVTEESE